VLRLNIPYNNYTCTLFNVFRGGKICLTDHFKPLWARNVPKFGIAHAMSLGVSNLKIIKG
jgi:hypothetical protein